MARTFGKDWAKWAITHGHTTGGTISPTYKTWKSVVERCTNPNHRRWKDYGGRGIKVCDRWRKFENFLADMGERPEGKTLDRKEVNGNYELNNCRWATNEEQAINRRDNRHLTYQGETRTVVEWAKKLGVKRGAISQRLCRDWSVDRALGQPFRKSPTITEK
jgi:hypothetical protein